MAFYSVASNTGYIRVNYISDDGRAAIMNAAGDPQAVMVTSPSTMGGYTYPILNAIAGNRIYQILKMPLPKSTPQEALVDKLLRQQETLYGYVDGNDVTIIQIEGWSRSSTPLSSLGFRITSSPKTFKRLKTANRPFRLWNQLDRPLRVYIVQNDDYSNEDFSDFEPEVVERLLDGAITIAPWLFKDCLPNVVFPDYDPNNMQVSLAQNAYRRQEFFRQAQNFHAFNGRIIGAMTFSGAVENLASDVPGMLKGEAFVDVSDTCERLNVDVICAASALKYEFGFEGMPFVLLEPQKAKRSGVNSDLQTMSNMPALYQFSDVRWWTMQYLVDAFERLKRDEVMESWYDMTSSYFNSSNRVFDEDNVITMTKWNARAWLMSGRRVTESPWLFERLGFAIAQSLNPADASKLRFPVPCAVRAQVISQSCAAMAGWDMEIVQGSARWCEELEALVVNDHDWLEMYRSHGGHDLDDFFVGYWRTIGNLRKIVVVRSPNDWGEYSVFDYVEGDWYPQFETYNGDIVQFPEVPADPELWAQRLSEAHAEGKIAYSGMPSKRVKPEKTEPHPYGLNDVMHLIQNNQGSASCVGANVNARVLWSLATRKHRTLQLASMEDCIDAGTQGGSAEDTDAVHAEAKEIVEMIIADPSLRIDQYVWISRFQPLQGMPFDPSRLDGKTHVSMAHRFRHEAARDFREMVRKYAQTLAKSVKADLDVHRLGRRMLSKGYNVLASTRLMMVRMQTPGQQELGVRDWTEVHQPVLAVYDSLEKLSDKHDFILGLYSACLKVPTASGKISDQLVMNPHIFPHLLEAMRFYGLAYHIDVTVEGKINRWKYEKWDLECKSCHSTHEVTDPVTVQNYHFYDGLCKDCRTS